MTCCLISWDLQVRNFLHEFWRRHFCPVFLGQKFQHIDKKNTKIIILPGSWYKIWFVSFKWGYQKTHSPPWNPNWRQATSKSAWVQFLELVQTDCHRPSSSNCTIPSFTFGPSTNRIVRFGCFWKNEIPSNFKFNLILKLLFCLFRFRRIVLLYQMKIS